MAYIDSKTLRSQPTPVILVPEAKAELFSLCPLTLTHSHIPHIFNVTETGRNKFQLLHVIPSLLMIQPLEQSLT